MFRNNHKENNRKKHTAFTLAEVLITLVVIGVVAALTIPGLIQGLQKDQYVVALRKAQSEITQAYNELKMDGGGDITYVFPGTDTGANAMNYFANKLSIVKNCGAGLGCWYASPRYLLNGNAEIANFDSYFNGGYGKAILSDGTMILMQDLRSGCTTTQGTGPLANATCGVIGIDINGPEGPNTSGRDYFLFHVTTTGIYPLGTYNDGYSCNPAGATSSYNHGCAAKILKEGAMNY